MILVPEIWNCTRLKLISVLKSNATIDDLNAKQSTFLNQELHSYQKSGDLIHSDVHLIR